MHPILIRDLQATFLVRFFYDLFVVKNIPISLAQVKEFFNLQIVQILV